MITALDGFREAMLG